MAKTISIVLGIIFIIMAIMGFANSGLVGQNGTFTTNTLHDLVHLVTGIIFLIVAFSSTQAAASTMKVLGIIYFIIGLLGLVAQNFMNSLLRNSSADTWLHLILGMVIFLLGWWASKSSDSTASSAPMSMNS